MSTIILWSMGQLFPSSMGGGFRGSVIDLVLYSGPVVKIVLLILLFFSILSWAIIFAKLRLIRRADRESRAFLHIFWEGKQLSAIFADSKKLRSSPTAEVFRAGYVELNKLSQAASNPDSPRKISDPTALNIELSGVDNISRSMRQATTSELTKLERSLGFLATTGSTTPFIGLFGTVWGIMAAFQSLGALGSASFASLAPGLSTALVATVGGLVAAIPASVMYNYLTNKIRILTSRMDSFALELTNIIQKQLAKG